MQPINNNSQLPNDFRKSVLQEPWVTLVNVPQEVKKRFTLEKTEKVKKAKKSRNDSPWIPKHLQDQDEDEESEK